MRSEMRSPVTFSAMNGVSCAGIDEVVLRKMRQAGFETLNLSLVSADRRVLEASRRPFSREQFLAVVESGNRLGLRVTAYFIIGMPGQTVEEMCGTLRLLAGTQCLAGASPFYFTPGSPIHNRERDNPRIRLASKGRDAFLAARLTALDLECDEFDRTDLFTLLRMTRVINYIKRGIDEGRDAADSFFEPARRVLDERRWFAESRQARFPLPFSERVASALAAAPLVVRGYRTPRSWV
jgi:radical SAM superfamily enzyme YgiQ (UPF0313 family)